MDQKCLVSLVSRLLPRKKIQAYICPLADAQEKTEDEHL